MAAVANGDAPGRQNKWRRPAGRPTDRHGRVFVLRPTRRRTMVGAIYDEEMDAKDAEDVDSGESTESSIDNDSGRDLRTPSAKQRKLLVLLHSPIWPIVGD